MPIALECPGCSARIAVSDNSPGKPATCPKCQVRFRVPNVTTPEPPKVVDYFAAEPPVMMTKTEPEPVDRTPVRKKRKRPSPSPKVPLREQKGIPPFVILLGTLVVLAAIILGIVLVLRWKSNPA